MEPKIIKVNIHIQVCDSPMGHYRNENIKSRLTFMESAIKRIF